MGKTLKEICEIHVQKTSAVRDAQGSFHGDLYNLIRDVGVHKAYVPRAYGGSEYSLSQICKLYFDLSRYSLDLPFSVSIAATTVIAVDLIRTFAVQKDHQRLLEKLVHEPLHFCIANSEAGTGTNPLHLRTSLVDSKFVGVKSCATNAPIADYFLISSKVPGAERANVEVFLVPKEMVTVDPLQDQMIGFRTSPSGKVSFEIENFNSEQYRLGPAASGVMQFRRCFDMERLLLCAMVAGLLQGVEDLAISEVQRRDQVSHGFAERQYIQQKVVQIFSAKQKLWSLVEAAAQEAQVETLGPQLGLMKIVAIEDGMAAALNLVEIFGHSALFKGHIAEKILRDFLTLRFFGGTQELQKISTFAQLMKAGAKPSLKVA